MNIVASPILHTQRQDYHLITSMKLRSIRNARIHKDVNVLVRADFDVPVEDGKIVSDVRIREVIPTLLYALRRKGNVRILAHRGRPGGVPDQHFTLEPATHLLGKILARKVLFIKDPLSPDAYKKYRMSRDILLFENIRFYKGEEKKDKNFAKKLSRWGDLYINEAFANSHRDHASMTLLPRLLPSYAGLRLEKEVKSLSRLQHPRHPFAALLGGAKLETKIPLLERFVKDADTVLVGGAVANALLALKGIKMGKSGTRPRIDSLTFLKSKKLILPIDIVVANSLKKYAKTRVVPVGGMKANEYAVDLGPATIRLFSHRLVSARTVVWNGPLGYIEVPAYIRATRALVETLRSLKAYKVAGGGDTLATLKKNNLFKAFTYISTGGGAMLEFLVGKKLPALSPLTIK